ncbi:hypothetical protein ACFL1U_02665 [Patescibacteria group bacterium]
MTLTQRQKNTGVVLIMIGSVIIALLTFFLIFRTPSDTPSTTNGEATTDNSVEVTGVELLASDIEAAYLTAASFALGHENYDDESYYYNLSQLLDTTTSSYRTEIEDLIAEPRAIDPTIPIEAFSITTKVMDIKLDATTVTTVTATVFTEQKEIREATTIVTNPTYKVSLQKIGDRWLVSDFALL